MDMPHWLFVLKISYFIKWKQLGLYSKWVDNENVAVYKMDCFYEKVYINGVHKS